ncbi:biotin/lipoyl-containing protein, partial [Thiohalocapsa halophila]
MASVEQVLLPDIGDFAEVEIIEVLVAEGDRIEPEQSILTLESDKATMEIPSPVDGTVKELKVAVGDKVSKDMLLMTVETADGAAEPAPATAETAPEPAASAAPAAQPDTTEPAAPAPAAASPAPSSP